MDASLAEIRLHEPDLPRDTGAWLGRTLAGEPWPYVMGPLLDRGAPNGVVSQSWPRINAPISPPPERKG